MSVDYEKHILLNEFVRHEINSIKKNSLFNKINFDNFFCDEKKCIIGSKKGSFYSDSSHLSIFGSLQIKNLIEKFF